MVLDERARYHRRLRRLRGAARRWTVLAAGFAGATAVLVPYQGIGAWDALWAGLSGASAVMAWWRWSDTRALAAQPEPEPLDPALANDRWLAVLAQLPGGQGLAEGIHRQRIRTRLRGSPAASEWERFDRSARTMRELTSRLGGVDVDAVREARGVERELQELTDRLASLEQALRTAPADAQPALRELSARHLTHLQDGATAYEQFVVAAAGYVSESAHTDPRAPALTGLHQATDRLRGVTAGLAELRQRYGSLPG